MRMIGKILDRCTILTDGFNLNPRIGPKFLPHIYTCNNGRMARFECRAKLSASLNRPECVFSSVAIDNAD